MVRNGTVYGDAGVVIARVIWKDDGTVVTLTGPDGVTYTMRPGRTEPLDWRDADEIVRPVLAQVRQWLTEHDYYL